MQLAIVLSLAACFCTATASVCQRLGAPNLATSPAALTAEAIGLLLLAPAAFALSRSDLITAEPAVPPPARERRPNRPRR